MGREALSAATAQAAEKAASSVRDFAQKSFRLSMDINLKAPLIIVPESSLSHNALVMDLGLIKVGNSFSLLPTDECTLPAIVDNLDIQLSQLKLSRLVFPVSRAWRPILHIWNSILSILDLNSVSFPFCLQNLCGPDIRPANWTTGTSKSAPEHQKKLGSFLVQENGGCGSLWRSEAHEGTRDWRRKKDLEMNFQQFIYMVFPP